MRESAVPSSPLAALSIAMIRRPSYRTHLIRTCLFLGLLLTSNCLTDDSENRHTDEAQDASVPDVPDASYPALFDSVVDWIRTNGGIFDTRQEVRFDNYWKSYGVYATEPIENNTLLSSIPMDGELILRSSSSEGACDTIRAIEKEIAKKETSSFYPQLQLLHSLQRRPLFAWSQAGQDLLGAVLGKNLPPRPNDWKLPLLWWNETCGGDADHLEALVLLLSGPGSPTLSLTDGSIMPLFAAYNHRTGARLNTRVVLSDKSTPRMEIYSTQDIDAGDEIYVTYTGSEDALGIDDFFGIFGEIPELPRLFSFQIDDDTSIDFVWDSSHTGGPPTIGWTDKRPPNDQAMDVLQRERERIELISDAVNPDNAYLSAVPTREKELIWKYMSTIYEGMDKAIKTTLPWATNNWTLFDYQVAGVNLAQFKLMSGTDYERVHTTKDPFLLYEDFDISHLIHGNEAWQDILDYRNVLQRPSLSFYVDKVARKRWLPTVGIKQPKYYALRYDFELVDDTGDLKAEEQAILNLLPSTTSDYVAKPSHHSETTGVHLVSHDPSTNTTLFTSDARALTPDTNHSFKNSHVAAALAKNLHAKPKKYESWALKNVRPGIVIEERIVDFEQFDRPPLEFNIFVIWGRVYAGQLRYVGGAYRRQIRRGGWIYRNGTFARGGEYEALTFDFVDWPQLVTIAEKLGAHKDMFRVDVLVGIPAGSPALQEGVAREERVKAVEYVVSESEIYPTTSFDNDLISEEAARLWIAGYKLGNYRVVPNTEVPREFLVKRFLSADFGSAA